MLRATLASAALSALMLLTRPAAAVDLLIDGVPLPPDAKAASPAESQSPLQRKWSGVWIGAWGGNLKHILIVESVTADGTARVVYSIGDNPLLGIAPAWTRHKAMVTDDRLTIVEANFSATYELSSGSALKATYVRGSVRSRAAMARAELAALTRPGAVVQWTRGRSELVPTELTEGGRPIRLEVVVFNPSGK